MKGRRARGEELMGLGGAGVGGEELGERSWGHKKTYACGGWAGGDLMMKKSLYVNCRPNISKLYSTYFAINTLQRSEYHLLSLPPLLFLPIRPQAYRRNEW